MARNEMTLKTHAELFLGRKLITSFQKLVMVSDKNEFVLSDNEKLFDEARRNTKVKYEKWANYYKRRRRDAGIKVNDWVLLKTHPLRLAAQWVVAKFLKTNLEAPCRVSEVKPNNLVVWKSGKRITVNVVQVTQYHHRKSDEMEIRTSSSNNNSSSYKSNNFEIRPPLGSWTETKRKVNNVRKETLAYKKTFKSGSGGPERKYIKGTGLKVDKRTLALTNSNNLPHFRKRFQTEEAMMPSTSGCNLRPRGGAKMEYRPANEKKTQQGGPVRSRRSREKQQYNPYAEE
ncbi:uncharacterized protein TNCV_2730351 [Trichonephila clavipes]|nr:uncharacterized protein TNCV_2730351 [Trichonephila clavipes]